MKVLNVGGNNKNIPLPGQYNEYDHVLLDIDPRGDPDIVCDARELHTLEPNQYDAVYCSHNLEHFHRHEIPKVLSGFLRVLKDDGFAHIKVPDLLGVIKAVADGHGLTSVLYDSPAGPITPLDVIYGHAATIERSGEDFYAHKVGFSRDVLVQTLKENGFPTVYSACEGFGISALAFTQVPSEHVKKLWDIE